MVASVPRHPRVYDTDAMVVEAVRTWLCNSTQEEKLWCICLTASKEQPDLAQTAATLPSVIYVSYVQVVVMQVFHGQLEPVMHLLSDTMITQSAQANATVVHAYTSLSSVQAAVQASKNRKILVLFF